MDIYCPRCSEPWDTDCLHDAVEEGAASSYDDARKQFRKMGCGLWGNPCAVSRSRGSKLNKGEATALAMDLLGDDLDGVASILDDASYLGVID